MSTRAEQGGWREVLRVSSADYYRLADKELARQLGGVFWIVGAIVALALLPLAPLDRAELGAGGWILGGACALASIGLGLRLLRSQSVGFDELLLHSLLAVVGVGVLMWLSGDPDPYGELLLFATLFVGAVHPPRRVLAFLVALAAVLASPLIYDSGDNLLASEVGKFVIWSTLALVATGYTSRIRLQRAGLVRRGDRALKEARADLLTGLGNRRAFEEAMRAATSRATRSGTPLSVIVVDLDSFKAINDEHGLVAGDHLLQGVARTIADEVRRPDSTFRWGGDEFAVLADVDRAGATQLSRRLAAAVAERCARPGGEPLLVHVGAAQLGVDGNDGESLLSAASAAMKGAERPL